MNLAASQSMEYGVKLADKQIIDDQLILQLDIDSHQFSDRLLTLIPLKLYLTLLTCFTLIFWFVEEKILTKLVT